jgi:NADH-quinone oxidoreductase subunit F
MELKGVYSALPFLDAVAQKADVQVGPRVAIIGGGNAAIDAARTVLRRGGKATVIYRRERKDMPAIAAETLAAEEEGAKFIFLAAPHRIIGDDQGRVKAIECVRTRLGEFDSSGRRKPINTTEIQRFDFDSVIFAIGEIPDVDFARVAGVRLRENGKIDVNRFTLETTRPRTYAGGDFVTGASNVSGAMGFGKRAARSIDASLMEADRWKLIQPDFKFDMTAPKEPCPQARHHGHEVAPAVRVLSEVEVVTGLTHEEAFEESSRCLRCDLTVASE